MEATSAETIKIAVVGAAGQMGLEVFRSIGKADGVEPVIAIDHNQNVGMNIRDLVGPKGPDLVIEEKLGAALDRVKVDVLVDFSHHSGASQHASSAVKRGVSPLIGTTGLASQELKEIKLMCDEAGVAGMYVPNFAIGAVLMMHFAEMASRWMPDVEIIELHHDRKDDAPSGTAMMTAEKVAASRVKSPIQRQANIRVEGARGGLHQNIPVHSIRLPGLVAHQMVIFGGAGETLTIRHDSMERRSFMEGVKLCVREIKGLKGFAVGMDSILFRA